MQIELGRTYKDKLSGFQGVAVGTTRWITGCDTVRLESQTETTDENLQVSRNFDVPMVTLCAKVKKIKPNDSEKPGGPKPAIQKADGRD